MSRAALPDTALPDAELAALVASFVYECEGCGEEFHARELRGGCGLCGGCCLADPDHPEAPDPDCGGYSA